MTPGVGHTQINTALDAVDGDFDRIAKHASSRNLAMDDAAAWLKRLDASGVSWLTRWDDAYPRSLHALKLAAPPLLFVRGLTPLLRAECIGIVGARVTGQDGLDAARAFANGCASQDIAVVSGGATGADRAAHEGAMDAGGATIVVLPCGISDRDSTRPFERWTETKRAVLISPFVPDLPWTTHAAMERNKMIAALSNALFVIEPGARGGSIRTARFALGLRRPVFVYGESPGVPILIREGATRIPQGSPAELADIVLTLRDRAPVGTEQTLL